MLLTAPKSTPIRIVSRKRLSPGAAFPVRTSRPSVFDFRIRGDIWLAGGGEGPFALTLDHHALAQVAGTRLDRFSLNHLLFVLRNRPIRR
jgi:hypothetical protein